MLLAKQPFCRKILGKREAVGTVWDFNDTVQIGQNKNEAFILTPIPQFTGFSFFGFLTWAYQLAKKAFINTTNAAFISK